MLKNPHQNQLHVVLVEDNEDSRMMMCELLELSGFQCRTAESGLMGLEIIEVQRPDVAIVDIGLPDTVTREHLHEPDDAALDQVDAGGLQRLDEAA